MTTLSYTLLINNGPDQGDQQARALRFAHALLQRGHNLRRVFFYGSAVSTALPNHASVAACWQALLGNEDSETELCLCSASAERLGVSHAPDRFIIAGLGSLIEAGFDSDRVITCD